MKVRGLRECQDCGRRWSYYETGSVACPSCESLRSVGVDERTRHTAGPAELDLTPHRAAIEGADEELPSDALEELKSTLREYARERGFIDAGELLPPDDGYLAAHELLQAADVFLRERRSLRGSGAASEERLYLYELLSGADRGERPATDAVPERMRAARGLAYADAVREYRREALTWLEDDPDPNARRVLGTLGEHVKRVRALQGDVPLSTAETLVTATTEVAAYLRGEDESALSRAADRLARLDV